MMCDGFDAEDTLAITAVQLAEYGWIVTGVGDPGDDGDDGSHRGSGEPPDTGPSWAYTVGLQDCFGHPELVVVGPGIPAGARLLHQVVRRIEAGMPLAPGRSPLLEDGIVWVGIVHPVQYSLPTFNMWHALHRHGHVLADHLAVLQVFAPRSWFCSCHQQVQPDLSDPGTVLAA